MHQVQDSMLQPQQQAAEVQRSLVQTGVDAATADNQLADVCKTPTTAAMLE